MIQQTTLEMIDKDENWLLDELKSQGIEDVSKIFLAEYNDGQIIVTK